MRTILRLAPVVALRLGEAGLRYGLNLVLAVSLGVAGAGQFYFGIALVSLGASLARCGVDSVAMKRLAVARGAGDAAGARGLVLACLGSAAGLGLALSLLLLLAAPAFPGDLALVVRVFAFGIGALAVQGMAGSLLAAMDRPLAGQAVSVVIWPALTVLAVLLSWPGIAMAGLVAILSMAAAAGLGAVLLWRALDGRLRPFALPAPRALLAAGLPFFGTEIVYLLLSNLAVIALALLVGEAEAGLFGLASRLSMLLTMLTVAMYALTAPRLARLHAEADATGLARAAHEATRAIALAGLPAAVLLLAMPAWLLGLFGEGFAAAAPALVVLTLGQVVNVVFSQGHTLLAMTGREGWLWRVALASLGTLLLALPLALAYGATGAAVATTLAGAVGSLGQAICVRRQLGIHILGAFRPQARAR
jgi:O-antigen/teichoic acid export membrane protein